MLDLYHYDTDNSVYVKHSKNGLFNNPAQTTHDGTSGEVIEKQFFLRNDDAGFYYTNLSLQALPLTKTAVDDINYPEAYISFKIIFQTEQPTSVQWKSIPSGNKASCNDIGATGTGDISYKSFWIQVSVPPGTNVQNINDITLHLEGEEHST